MSTISLYFNPIPATISSRSLYFTFLNSVKISLPKWWNPAKLQQPISISVRVPLSSTSLTCNSISFWDESSNISIKLSKFWLLSSGIQRLAVVIEKLLFSSNILKTEFVASKLLTANNNFPSSGKFIRGLNEKIFHDWVCSISSSSCGFVLVCSKTYVCVFSWK